MQGLHVLATLDGVSLNNSLDFSHLALKHLQQLRVFRQLGLAHFQLLAYSIELSSQLVDLMVLLGRYLHHIVNRIRLCFD